MDIKKLQTLGDLTPPSPIKQGGLIPAGGALGTGPSFQETMSGLQSTPGASGTDAVAKSGLVDLAQSVKFSNHAVERMQTRGISFNKTDLDRLNEAVGKAAAKGSKDSLILMNDSALIVSVKNKTVVTVMDKAALKENVFTNIDSTIVM